MFFNNIAHVLGNVPDNIINELMEYYEKFEFKLDNKLGLCARNQIYNYVNTSGKIHSVLTEIKNFIKFQNYDCIKNSECCEMLITLIPDGLHMLNMPTRYISFIGDQLVIPLNNSITIISKENNRPFTQPYILDVGYCYRINNRVPLKFINEHNFVGLVLNFVNQDLKNKIPIEQLNSPFPRQNYEIL